MHIDLNCDLGEGYGQDDELMTLVTSANISCGFHAGNSATAANALIDAKDAGVRAGAHPGFPERETFGRREMSLSESELLELCCYQVGALTGLARMLDVPLTHLKPHGALYNMACREDRYAWPIVVAASLFQLPLLALPGSRLEALSQGKCVFFREGFADRRYRPDGALVPRSEPDAFIHDPEEAAAQAERLIRERQIHSLCVHGDNPQAVAFVKHLREALTRSGFTLRAFA